MTTPTKLRSGMRLSVAEYLEMDFPEPDDKRKPELDDGELYIMPRPRLGHQLAQGELFYYCKDYLKGFAEPPAEVWQDVVIALPSERPRLFIPDLAIILRGNPATVSDLMVEGVPDIVVAVLSSDRSRDLVRKRQVYAEAGIPEYWICDWRNEAATLLELQDGCYVERAGLSAGGTLATPLLPGLAIPLDEVFRRQR